MTKEKQVAVQNGFSWLIAAIFIVGETAGSGLVAMPNAVKSTGFIGGLALLCLLAIVNAHTAKLLGNNWLIMQKKWPEYLNICRNPYPEMAFRAMGRKASLLTHFLIQVSLFGGTSVFSILAARNISELLHLFGIPIHFCVCLFALSLFLWPFMMLRSPMNFWQVSIGAALSTVVAVVLILVGISIDFSACFEFATYESISSRQFTLGFGTIVFSFGGHPVFPTIQHDMAHPRHFSKAVTLSYLTLFLLYCPVALGGYAVYGSSLSDSIISSIQTPSLRLTINILITLHVLFSILIIVNPLHQAVEEYAGVKHEFGLGRILVRSAVLFSTTLAASLLPNFGVFLDLVGSSAMTLLALVFPALFSLYLKAQSIETSEYSSGESDHSQAPTLKRVLLSTKKKRLSVEISIIIGALVFGAVATINTLTEALHSPLASPCFVQLLSASRSNVTSLSTHYCCGPFRNISSNYRNICSA